MSDHVRDSIPRVAIFDIDGVLADVRHRLPYISGRRRDWDSFFAEVGDDALLASGAEAVRAAVAEGLSIVYLTGRPERCRQDTVQWLRAHGLPDGLLLMRGDADRRPARVLKPEALQDVRSRADIVYVVDDDREVTQALAAAGFTVRLAEWMPREEPLTQAQESFGRT
ncbi:MAG: hypothetical protein RL134_61 [Actinomycetota bacterium]|jgi:phosphoglycolate phosphatase-like HAD superfamily hydrolase